LRRRTFFCDQGPFFFCNQLRKFPLPFAFTLFLPGGELRFRMVNSLSDFPPGGVFSLARLVYFRNFFFVWILQPALSRAWTFALLLTKTQRTPPIGGLPGVPRKKTSGFFSGGFGKKSSLLWKIFVSDARQPPLLIVFSHGPFPLAD